MLTWQSNQERQHSLTLIAELALSAAIGAAVAARKRISGFRIRSVDSALCLSYLKHRTPRVYILGPSEKVWRWSTEYLTGCLGPLAIGSSPRTHIYVASASGLPHQHPQES